MTEKQTLRNSRPSIYDQRKKAYSAVGTRIQVAASVSKLREGNMPHHRKDSLSAITNAFAQSDAQRISEEQQLRMIDNENAIALMPEIEWACRVLVSSILSPKDMTKRELIYTIDMDWLPFEIRSAVIEKVQEDMEVIYGYSESLYPIFKDALFVKGAHPRLVLPEAAVDRVINSGETLTLESLKPLFASNNGLRGKGYLGPRQKSRSTHLNMESFEKAVKTKKEAIDEQPLMFEVLDETDGQKKLMECDLLTITDSIDALKIPSYMDAIMQSQRSDMSGRPKVDVSDFEFTDLDQEITNEAFSAPAGKKTDLSNDEFRGALYKAAPTNIVTHLRIPGRDSINRRSVGRPLVQSLPAEAVIPLHVPGDPKRHIGYLVLYDENGHPITLAGAEQVVARASALYNATNSSNAVGRSAMGSMIISKAARNLTGGNDVTQFHELSKIFEELVEEDILTRLKNGAFPTGAEIADTNDLYTLMLARTLSSMRTRIVFIPVEMISYFAFDYHNNGVGKSLLDANKMLISMRAGMLLARTTGEMRNSIPLTEVTVKIDEDDPDWEKTLEDSIDLMSKTRQPQYPLTTLAVNDLMDWIHRAGFVYKFEGHPQMPDSGYTFEKIRHDNQLPDQEFYQELGKQLYMGFGIPPELMDTTYDPEFATAIAARNIMFTQTILEQQKKASAMITDDIRRLVLSDGTIVSEIVTMLKAKWAMIAKSIPAKEKKLYQADPKGYAKNLIERIIESIIVKLPSPDTTTLANQMQDFTEREDAIEKGLNYVLGPDVLSADIGGELVGKLEAIRGTVKSALMRQWMADNGVLPELAQIAAVDEGGKPAFDLFNIEKVHLTGIMTNLLSFARAIAPLKAAVQKDSEALELGDQGADAGGSFDTGAGDDSGMDGFGGFGDDDMSAESSETELTEGPSDTQPEGDSKPDTEASI